MPPELQPGDLLIQKSSGFFGEFLRFFVGFWVDPRYQHVLAVWRDTGKAIQDGEDHDEETGEVFYRVGVDSITNADWSQYVVRRPKCDAATKQLALDAMETKLGQPYGVLSLAAVFFRKFLGWPIPDGPGDFCSELVCWGYSSAGYDLVPGLAAYDVAPWELETSDRLETIWDPDQPVKSA